MKNIIKLIAVVALCFLIGGVLVACGDKGEYSAPYIGENGNWFVDGEDTGVAAQGKPGADGEDATVVDCEHEWSVYEIPGYLHTQTTDGKVIKACDLCGYAVVGYETVHTWVEDNYEATCEEAAFNGEKCAVCGLAGEGESVGEPLGHNWTEGQPVGAEPLCTHGGVIGSHCLNCNEEKHVTTEAVGHKSNNWQVVTPASKASEGKLSGLCVYCNETVDYTLPKLDGEKYTVASVAPTCSETGTETYSYVDEKAGVEYEIVLTIAASGHQLAGKDYAKYDIDANDGIITVPYWYGEADEEGRLPALGVNEFADSTIACGETALGWFLCEACNEVVDVNIYKAHNGVSEVVTAATCISVGYNKVTCDVCGPVDGTVEVPVLDHAWVTTLVQNGLTWDLVSECKGNGVADSACTASQVIETGITDVIKEDVKAATCTEEGIVKYSYTKEGVVYDVEVTVAKLAHTLNGVTMDTLVNDDDPLTAVNEAGTYDHTIEGLSNFAGDEFGECETITHGYYVCECCEDVVYVNVLTVHTPVNPQVTTPADCTQTGVMTYQCSACEKDIEETILALGHNKTYELVKGEWILDLTDDGVDNAVTYKFALHTNCDRANCLEQNIEPVQYFEEAEEVDKKDPTCYSKGYITYAVEIGGVEFEVTVELGIVGHTLNGVRVDSEEFANNYVGNAIKSSVEGINSFADDDFVCETVVHGYYECDVCKAAEKSFVVYVDVYQEHSLILSGDSYTAPTCTVPGSALCSHCVALGNNNLVTIPALGHDYEISVKEVNVNGLQVILTATCAREGCDFSDDSAPMFLPVLTSDLYVSEQTAPGCLVEGAVEYTIGWDLEEGIFVKADDEKSDVTIDFEVAVPATGHAAQTESSVVLEFVVEEKNMWYKVYVCEDCGTYILIDSGKIEEETETPEA